jgi:hypothetical protein
MAALQTAQRLRTSTNPQGNGAKQNPEIILIFWQDASPNEWTSPTSAQSPTRSQIIGSALAIVNGPYFGALQQYGTNNGGVINPARMSPYAPVFTGAPFGSRGTPSGGFTMTDVANVISTEMLGLYVPAPQANENMIYVVVTPNGDYATGLPNGANVAPGSCNNGQLGCYDGVPFSFAYISGSPGSPQSIPPTFVFSHEVAEAISGYSGVGLGGCTNTQVTQISDLCKCYTETQQQGTLTVQAYWSVLDHACVIPEAWGPLVSSAGWSYSWAETRSGNYIRQASGGAGGVVYTDDADNVHFFNGNPNSTDLNVGGPGSEFAAGGNIIAGLTVDTKYGVNYFTISTQQWTGIGTPNGPVTSVSVTRNGVIVITDAGANPWYWMNGGWHLFGGPGDQFLAFYGDILAITPSHSGVFDWPAANFGPGGNWSEHWPDPASALVSSPDTYYGGFVFGGTQNFWDNGSNLGQAFQGSVSNGYLSSGLQMTNAGEVQMNFENVWYNMGEGPVGRLVSGNNVMATSCPNGAMPCVLYCAPLGTSCNFPSGCCSGFCNEGDQCDCFSSGEDCYYGAQSCCSGVCNSDGTCQ